MYVFVGALSKLIKIDHFDLSASRFNCYSCQSAGYLY